jgi:3-oxoacyl-[acyl-carrier-protein] synthase III
VDRLSRQSNVSLPLQILGAGHYFAPVKVGNNFLKSLGIRINSQPTSSNLSEEEVSRFSCLPLEHIQKTRNRDLEQARRMAVVDPSEMGCKAALMAIEAAGIEKEQVGLVICDVSLPFQTTPSEAQRIAKLLDLKVPAYDISSISSALLMQLHVLNNWKGAALEEYVLVISTNAPTVGVDYSRGLEANYLSDGAAAFVVSKSRAGKLSVIKSIFMGDSLGEELASFGLFEHVKMDCDRLFEYIRRVTRDLLTKNQSILETKDNLIAISTLPEASDSAPIFKEFNLLSQESWSRFCSQSTCLGADLGILISQKWNEFKSGENIAVALAGFGYGKGFIHLAVNNS